MLQATQHSRLKCIANFFADRPVSFC
ncbi:protein of unknown function [Burkholderia multivorans]